ncbi:MAG: ABC transporter permease subunit [Bacillota bacterium]
MDPVGTAASFVADAIDHARSADGGWLPATSSRGERIGVVARVVMRMIDLMLSFPGVLLAIFLVSVLGPALNNLIIILAMARVMRGNVMVIMKEDYIESARAHGASALRIMLRHLLPNCMSPIIVYGALPVVNALLVAASELPGAGYSGSHAGMGVMVEAGRIASARVSMLLFSPGWPSS